MNEKEESKQFRKSLFDFWVSKGVSNLKIPQIGGRELDLYHLYRAVCQRGGAQSVSQNKLWKDIVNEFGLPPSCTSASFTLRNHYIKYLLEYEQKFFFGKDEVPVMPEVFGSRPRKQIKPSDDQNSMAKTDKFHQMHMPSQNLHLSHSHHNHHGHHHPLHGSIDPNSSAPHTEKPQTSSLKASLLEKYAKRDIKTEEIFHMNKAKLYPQNSEIKRIILAFESHLQQEVILAINSLLLYSTNSSQPFILESHPSLLESIMNYLEEILKNAPSLLNKMDSLNVFENYNYNISEIIFSEKKDRIFTPIEIRRNERKKEMIRLRYEEVSEVQLIEQIRTILLVLRNLSYIKANETPIFKTDKVFRTVMKLFISSPDAQCQRTTLEIISNIARNISLKNLENQDKFCQRILHFLYKDDNSDVESAVDCLRNLMVSHENESYLEILLQNNLDILINLLISNSHDVREGVLELLTFLSDLKMSTRVAIAKQPKCINRLIALMCSGSGKQNDKVAKLCALILSNISMAPASKGYFHPFERDLFVVAATDESVSKIICNLLADLENMPNESALSSKQDK